MGPEVDLSIYLKDNPYKMEAIAFMEFDMPDKIKDFINEYIDRDKSFQTMLKETEYIPV